MEPELVLQIAHEACITLFKISMPILLAVLISGVIISLIQAVTQVQEPTLTLVPKLFALIGSLLIFMPYMSGVFSTFYEYIISFVITR
ncbi:Flagellar biosynthetic protein FliQ [Candidatus Cyrtobacter comes]|uniref:Flagellar biosynthetic protein FliQ n=1 Tax=Candidatus Cyrtobacter comes TaxID=675776 RepID=A0ABU5L7D3_9RICK|nr:flagellar biosynthetic protein FliQ [Candidatus Cyrtobacter comes]MDZ5762034.1 Flagellar biosynthetic protein FliQ [Candidatus Cyrtobacter comes]